MGPEGAALSVCSSRLVLGPYSLDYLGCDHTLSRPRGSRLVRDSGSGNWRGAPVCASGCEAECRRSTAAAERLQAGLSGLRLLEKGLLFSNVMQLLGKSCHT
ncbi:hypothetical protein WMY93_004887 [Mugilogobius chulae]|uniref:Uncharacterized protein n=1 Tax=Mugilogobius chulae TaxID=88201 RepID=A0AAW0PTC8_9GOBI